MERIYEFEKNAYRNKVLLVNYILILILGFCLYRIFFAGSNTLVWAFASAICVYSLAGAFLRKSNPKVIKVSDEEIAFRSFGEKRFAIDKITKFRVRVLTPNYQLLVRVEDSEKGRGSFWVTHHFFSDKTDLLAEFDYLEKKIHPNSLRFRGREEAGRARPVPPAEKPPESG